MLLLHPAWVGLLGLVALPIVLHLWSRRKQKTVEWGAMQFLRATEEIRKRSVRLEDALLLAVRCLCIGLVALLILRPFAPHGSSVSWGLVLPVGLVGIAGLGVTASFLKDRKKALLSFVLTVLALFLLWFFMKSEGGKQAARLGAAGSQDVVFVVDSSMSMGLWREGTDNLSRALAGVRRVLTESSAGDRFALLEAGEIIGGAELGFAPGTEVAGRVSGLAGSGGSMRGARALAEAVRLAGEGTHPSRKIVLITDRQRVGWELDADGLWEGIKTAVDEFPVPPQLVLWEVPFPEDYRNAAVTDIELPLGPPSAGEPARIVATIENTGRVAVTPREIGLEVAGEVLPALGVDQIAPGQSRQVEFQHTFPSGGATSLRVAAQVGDDLPSDDALDHALVVGGNLRVLVLDAGRNGPGFFERGSAFASLALAKDKAGEGIDADFGPVTDLGPFAPLSKYGTIILAGVPELSVSAAATLGAFVDNGGGLVVALGAGTKQEFYADWKAPSGGKIVPLEIRERVEFSRIADGIIPAPASLRAGLLASLADPAQSDLASTRFSGYWRFAEPDGAGDVDVVVRSSAGHPIVVGHDVGDGRVFTTAFGLDGEDSNLVSRETFVPFVHELCRAAAGGADVVLNLPGSRNTEVLLQPGLPGVETDLRNSAVEVVDPLGRVAEGELVSDANGIRLGFPWAGEPGLHRFVLPRGWAGSLPALLGPEPNQTSVEEKEVAFSIRGAGREGHAELLTGGDLEVLREVFDVVEVGSAEEVLALLSGTATGRELWRYLAYAVLGFLLLEGLLARWIARKRRVADGGRAAFTPPDSVSAKTRGKLASAGKGGGR